MPRAKKTEAGYLEFRAGDIVGRLSVKTVKPFDMSLVMRNGKDVVGRVTAYLPELDMSGFADVRVVDQLGDAIQRLLEMTKEHIARQQEKESA